MRDSHAWFLNLPIMTSCHGYRLILKSMELCLPCIRVWNKVKPLQLRYEVFSSVIRSHVKFNFTTTMHALTALSIWKTRICHLSFIRNCFRLLRFIFQFYVADHNVNQFRKRKPANATFKLLEANIEKECAKELLKFGTQHMLIIKSWKKRRHLAF